SQSPWRFLPKKKGQKSKGRKFKDLMSQIATSSAHAHFINAQTSTRLERLLPPLLAPPLPPAHHNRTSGSDCPEAAHLAHHKTSAGIACSSARPASCKDSNRR